MTRTQRKYEARRLEILQAAAAAFSRKGFASATMEEIGEALDLTKGSLYYYFESKHDLLYFCQRYSLDRLLDDARRILETDQPAPRRLYDVIVSQLHCMLEEVGGSVAHLEFGSLAPERLEQIIALRDGYEELLRKLVRSGVDQGDFYDVEPRMVVWALLGSLNWTVQWFSPDGERSVAEIAHGFAQFLVRGITRAESLPSIPEAPPQPVAAAQ